MIEKRRYSPLLILFEIGKVIKDNIFIIIILFFTNQSESGFMNAIRYGLVALVTVSIVAAIVNWFVKKYEANEYAFILYSGIFNRKEQTVPFERIQNVHTSKNVVHRLFGATALTIETASSGDDSAVNFPVLRMHEAEEIRQIIHREKQVQVEEVENGEPVFDEGLHVGKEEIGDKQTSNESVVHFTPTKKDLLIASFASFNFLIIFPAIFFLLQIIEQVFSVEDDTIDGVIDWFASLSLSTFVYVIIGGMFLLISAFIGIVWTFMKYGNYELSSDDDTIYIRKGIWEEKHLTIKKSRVQGVQMNQNILKRILGLTSVQLVMIQDGESDVSVLYPFLPTKRAVQIIEAILPQYEIREETHKLSAGAFYVRFLTTTFVFGLISIPPFFIQPDLFGTKWVAMVVGPVLYILIMIVRYLTYKQTAYRFDEQFIQWRIGGLGTLRFITTRKQIIEVEVDCGPLQRFFNLRSINVSNRAKPVGVSSLADLPSQDALAFIDWYYEREQEIVRIDDTYETKQVDIEEEQTE